jgi:predicted SAM-dependent methyltransferase
MLRAAARRLLPFEARTFVRRGLHVAPSLGFRYRCPFCHLRFRKLEPRGRDLPVYAEQGVVGGGYRLAECPWCRSNDRERLLYLFLRRHTELFRKPMRVLHLAPEARLRRAIEPAQAFYTTADLRMPGVDLQLDVTDIPRPDAAFDAIICSHVLEHVHFDRAAMRELHRVLAPGGWALLQVPIASRAERTEEEASSAPLSDEERARRFGDPTHVRLYAERDYVRRLEEAGFAVSARDALELLGKQTVRNYALVPEEKIFLCTRRCGATEAA